MRSARSPDPALAAPGARPTEGVDDLFRLVYDDLRRIARRQLARLRPGESLSPTGLVHDVYVRLADQTAPFVRDEQHFRALAARVMRQVIIDHVRHRTARKRGGGAVLQTLSDVAVQPSLSAEDLLVLDEALDRLALLDERQARIVELRFFGGLEGDEIADAMHLSERTIKREWQKARIFLYDALHGHGV